MSNTITFVCEKCHLEFEAPKGSRRKICDNCKWEQELKGPKYKGVEKKASKRAEPSQTLEEINREIAAYNKEHGTRLTYGKYMALKRTGIIL